jgi:hypothetical protein
VLFGWLVFKPLIFVSVQVEGECVDGEELRLQLPAEEDINKAVVMNREAGTVNLRKLSSPCSVFFLLSLSLPLDVYCSIH